MHAHSRFTINLTATDSDIKKLTALLAEELDDQDCFEDYDDFDEDFDDDEDEVEADENDTGESRNEFFEVEDCFACVWLEDIESLAAKMARLAPDASFDLDGYVDTSESAGEYMDFSITYSNGKLTSASSGWYTESSDDFFLDCYPDYEAFSEDFWNDEDDCPLYTEEEYEDFCTWDELFFVGAEYKTITAIVPLEFTKDINIEASSDEENDKEDN